MKGLRQGSKKVKFLSAVCLLYVPTFFAFFALCVCQEHSLPWRDVARSASFVNLERLDEMVQRVKGLPVVCQKKVEATLASLASFPKTAEGLLDALVYLEKALVQLPSTDEPYSGEGPCHSTLRGAARFVFYGLASQAAVKIKGQSDLKQAVELLQIARSSTILGDGPLFARKPDPLLWEEISQALGGELWKEAYQALQREENSISH